MRVMKVKPVVLQSRLQLFVTRLCVLVDLLFSCGCWVQCLGHPRSRARQSVATA